MSNVWRSMTNIRADPRYDQRFLCPYFFNIPISFEGRSSIIYSLLVRWCLCISFDIFSLKSANYVLNYYEHFKYHDFEQMKKKKPNMPNGKSMCDRGQVNRLAFSIAQFEFSPVFLVFLFFFSVCLLQIRSMTTETIYWIALGQMPSC